MTGAGAGGQPPWQCCGAATRQLRVWRGDAAGGGLVDYTVPVHEGEVVLDVLHRLQATQAGRPGDPVELQGRQVRLVQRRDQRPPEAAVHDPAVGAAPGPDHDHPAAHVPGDPRPGHRRVGQLRLGAAGAVVRPAGGPEARRVPDGPGRRRPQPGVPQVHRVLAVPGRLPRDPRPRGQQARPMPGRGTSSGTPSWTCTRWTPATGAGCCASQQGLGLCNITKCCTEVCPAGIKITDNAIIPMKERSADQRYDPLGRVLRSWRRREGRPPAG